MNHLRLHGDPFGDDVAAGRLRSFLRLCLGSGVRCGLSLSGVRPRPVAAGETEVALTDGVTRYVVGTRLPPAEVELLVAAAATPVPATAPIAVFAAQAELADTAATVGFEWPEAASVIEAREDASAVELLARVRAELRWSGSTVPANGFDERELAPWQALPAPVAGGAIVHVGTADGAGGTDAVVAARAAGALPGDRLLRIVLVDADEATRSALAAQLSSLPGRCEVVAGPFRPEHAADAVLVLLPWRRLWSARVLVQAMASGRPVCASRFAATAPLLGRHGAACVIGGHCNPTTGSGLGFEPDPASLAAAVAAALQPDAAAVAARARRRVAEHFTGPCPLPAPAAIGGLSTASRRPRIVLEAPFFETSSSSELSIETARALVRRGNVDVALVPTAPFAHDLAGFRRRAPDLEPLLTRSPCRADLWLASGWPVRADRPAGAARFALRFGWEYGSLPIELVPPVAHEADHIVVHSDHVRDVVRAAGTPAGRVTVVPHGVDAAIHEDTPPDAEILAWKGDLPAVLFCGGLVWRKGFDVFLRAVLAARAAGLEFAVVVKTVGHDRHYSRFHLRELVERFRRTPGTPPLLLLERELSRHDLAAVYTACDVLLHPYRGEGFCLPVLEARAAGLPVIATGGGATDAMMVGPGALQLPSQRRAIELPTVHAGAPWVLEPDGEAAAAALIDALQNLPLRRRAARAFAAAVRGAFTWNSAAASLEALAGRAPASGATEPVVELPAAPRPERVPAAVS